MYYLKVKRKEINCIYIIKKINVVLFIYSEYVASQRVRRESTHNNEQTNEIIMNNKI